MDENFPRPEITDLPDVVIEYILSYLSPYDDLKQCKLVSKAWYEHVKAVVRKLQRDFNLAISSISVKWECLQPDPGPTISKRYSHCAAYLGESMYVFGGCTADNTTFNDLWRFDLKQRCWIRPLATGTYPPPKASASLVAQGDNLILFGGWTHSSSMHQVCRIFSHLHIHNTMTNRWTEICTPTPRPALAGHAASMVNNQMIVFGGLWCPNSANGYFTSSNDIWVFDATELTWRKQLTSSQKPLPRYGHSQVLLDDNHLLIIGGCGGPNMLFSDMWLLTFDLDSPEPWQWKGITVLDKENGAPQLSFHPACKVGNFITVLSKSPHTASAPSRLPPLMRAPSRTWIPPRAEIKMQIDEDSCVNGKRGVLKRPLPQQNLDDNYAEEGPSTSSNTHKVPTVEKEPSDQVIPNLPQTSDSSPTNKSQSNKEFPSIRPNSSKNRQRQLEGLDRMEQRLKSLRAANLPKRPASCQRKTLLATQHKANKQFPSNCPLHVYVLDITKVISDGTVAWLPTGKQKSKSKDIILYSLVAARAEIIMFGGIQRDLSVHSQEGDPMTEAVSNALHFMTAERIVI